MLRIEVEANTDRRGLDSAACEVAGKRYRAESRSGALCELARVLAAAGVPDGPWQSWHRGVRSLSGQSWRELAGLRVREDRAAGARFAPWDDAGWQSEATRG